MIKKSTKSGLNPSIGTKIMLIFFFIFTLLIFICSYNGFLTETERLTTSFSKNIEQSETAIVTAVTLVSHGTTVLSSVYDQQLGDALNLMEAAYTAAGSDPEKMDLSHLQAAIQENVTGEVKLYIIDEENVIIHTTDADQMGTDFSVYPVFSDRLTSIREGAIYVGDPWEQSVLNPDLVRKYAYLPTPDHRYILEIGLYNKQFANPGNLFFSFSDVTKGLERADNTIESVLLVDANGVFVEKSTEDLERWYTSLTSS